MSNESVPEPRQATPPGQIDDLFDYDVGLDDILQDVSTTNNTNAPKQSSGPDGSGLGLGLDEEVKVSKKRQPVAKLDENRLLSQRGIPKLRRAAKTNLRFKGKGHEFSDAARLLNFYQLWLDDLFPRAKFADGLSMIEKLGHSKRLQTMRRAWIDEERPNASTEAFENTLPERSQKARQPSTGMPRTGLDGLDTDAEQLHLGEYNPATDRTGTDQELFMSDNEGGQQDADESGPVDDDPDDDLDVLLREQDNGDLTTNNHQARPEPGDDGEFNDALDVLRELEDTGPTTN